MRRRSKRFSQYRPVADVIGEDQDQPGVEGIAFRLGKALVRGKQFGVEIVRAGDVRARRQRAGAAALRGAPGPAVPGRTFISTHGITV